jgi:hypothetical protein
MFRPTATHDDVERILCQFPVKDYLNWFRDLTKDEPIFRNHQGKVICTDSWTEEHTGKFLNLLPEWLKENGSGNVPPGDVVILWDNRQLALTVLTRLRKGGKLKKFHPEMANVTVTRVR